MTTITQQINSSLYGATALSRQSSSGLSVQATSDLLTTELIPATTTTDFIAATEGVDAATMLAILSESQLAESQSLFASLSSPQGLLSYDSTVSLLSSSLSPDSSQAEAIFA